MSLYLPLLWFAGLLQLAIAASNFFAATMLDYRKNLSGASPIVREIFWVQNAYIELVLVLFSALTFLFPGELVGGSSLGRFVSGFLTFFWGLRLVIQLAVYDQKMRREYLFFDRMFLAAQTYLTGVFALAALGWWAR